MYECLWQCDPQDSSCASDCEARTPGPAIGEFQDMAGCFEARCAPGVVPQTCQDLIETHCTAKLGVCETANCRTAKACLGLCGPEPTEECDAQLQAICDDLPDAAYSTYLDLLSCAAQSCLRGDDLNWALFFVLR